MILVIGFIKNKFESPKQGCDLIISNFLEFLLNMTNSKTFFNLNDPSIYIDLYLY